MLAFAKEMLVAADYWWNKRQRRKLNADLHGLGEHGCVKRGHGIDSQAAKKLGTLLESSLSDPRVLIWRDQLASDERIYGFERLVNDVVDVCGINELKEIGSKYVGRPLKSWFMMANRVRCAPGNLGSGGGWHRDSPFTHQFKSILYLSDVQLDNGPFEYVPYSHLTAAKLAVRGSVRLDQSRICDEEFRQSRLESQPFTGPAGTLLLADTRGIHRGRPIKMGARYAITTYFFEKEVPSQFEKLMQK